jgi:hypothetical protein
MERELTDWISGFMKYMEEMESPTLFNLWTGVSCVAAALQRKCYLEMGMLTFYPNLYILLVGPSGARKGTAMEPGRDLLDDIGIRMSSQAVTLQQLVRAIKQSSSTEVDQPSGEVHFHCSLTVYSKEFTVFLGYQNKELMAHLCDWYDCDKRWTYETVSRGKEEIIGVWLNIIGATTPKLIQSSLPMDAIGGGLTSRMIIVFEEGKERFAPYVQRDEKLRTLLRNDLEKIYLLRGKFKITKQFLEKWIEWYSKQEVNPPTFYDDRFEGYLGRRPAHILKLCMVMSASARGDMVINSDDLQRATAALETAEIKMPRAFSGVGQSKFASLIEPILGFIAEKKSTDMTELMRVFYHDADVWAMERVLEVLSTQKYIMMSGRKITYIKEI